MVKARVLTTIQSSGGGYTYKRLKHLGLLVVFVLFSGVLFGSSNTFATFNPNEPTLTITTTDINTSFNVDNSEGTFIASTPGEFTVSTNNYTGYTLNLAASPTNITPNTTNDASTYTKLVNIDNNELFLNSISSASTPEQFNVGNWGYLISKLNSSNVPDNTLFNNSLDNTLYQPAPDLDGITLDITNEANTIDSNTNELVPNTYNITLGLKADYETPVGTYANTYILEAVANHTNYAIYYNANTTDTVDGIPDTQSGDTTADSITLGSTTPTRAHYTFIGWCTVTPTTTNGVDSCSGTTYQPSNTLDLNQSTNNNITLRAMWKIDRFTLTVNKGSNISSVSGAGTYNYGEQVTVSATKQADTTCVAYATPAWSRTAGSSTLSATSGASIKVTITDNTTISASSTSSNKSQTITLSRGTGVSSIKIGSTNYTASSVSLTCGNYSISGNYSSGYTFSAWSRANNVTVANTGAASTTMTVSGPGTLTLTGKANKIYIQNVTTSSCPTSRTLVYDSRDNKSYYIQKIGSVCWMTSNLAYATNASKIDSTYGGYYNWNNAKKVCPSGWTLPASTNYWTLISSYNTGAKLVAAPWHGAYGGNYNDYGSAYGVGSNGWYWSSTESDSLYAVFLDLKDASTYSTDRSSWLSVRCVAN